jgi:anaerobic selenocysteine-containing dehydrogenase
VAIVCELAHKALAGRSRVPWLRLSDDYDAIREHIARVVPGFHDFNTRVRESGGFALPNAARERNFTTATGRARFTVNAIPRHALPKGRYLMMTIRSHDQYNTTIYGLDDRYRGVHGGRRVIFMNEMDIAAAGLAGGDLVDITSHFADGEREATHFVVVPFDIPPGCTATYFPETNVLVPLDSVADGSRTPTSKSIVVSVTRSIAAPPSSSRRRLRPR